MHRVQIQQPCRHKLILAQLQYLIFLFHSEYRIFESPPLKYFRGMTNLPFSQVNLNLFLGPIFFTFCFHFIYFQKNETLNFSFSISTIVLNLHFKFIALYVIVVTKIQLFLCFKLMISFFIDLTGYFCLQVFVTQQINFYSCQKYFHSI